MRAILRPRIVTTADDIRHDRRYTRSHEWARLDGHEVVVGISAHALDHLRDPLVVGFGVRPGEIVEAGAVFGSIESLKAISDLLTPVRGRVARVNLELLRNPEVVREDCYERGWMVSIIPADADGYHALLDARAYAALLHEHAT